MIRQRQLEVRHTQGQRQLLGWVQVPDELMQLGKKITIHGALDMKYAPPTQFEVVSLPGGFGHNYLALKADGYTAVQLASLLDRYEFVPARR